MLRIKNGTVIDGTGKPGYKADIITSGDRIAAIGHFSKNKDVETIDALGCIVAPGFIDVNTDSDHQLTLFSNPEQQDFIAQGVTTIIGGLCGASLAPLIDGNLDSIRKWADTNQINIHWRSLKELRHILERQKLGVNFGTFVGHGTIRRAITQGKSRDLTEREFQMMGSVIRDALKDGALGLSTGLGFAHSNLTPWKEIHELTKIVARHGKVYATHLRNDREEFEHGIMETLAIAKESGVKTIINHLRAYKGLEEKMWHGMQEFRMHWKKLHCRADVTPCVTYTFPIYELLPRWARRGSLEHMMRMLKNPTDHEAIKKSFGNMNAKTLRIVHAPHYFFIGKTVEEFAKNRELDVAQGLLELMKSTNLRAQLSYDDINEARQLELIDEPWTLVGGGSASRAPMEDTIAGVRECAPFERYFKLGHAKKKTAEELIKKITSAPAAFFNIKHRGIIKEGAYADIVIIQNTESTEYAEGNAIENVIINGKIAMKNKKLTNMRCGGVLKE